jgi:hypothetical protein
MLPKYLLAPGYKRQCAQPILPVQYPRNKNAFVTTFFVCPAVFAVLKLRTSTKLALYAPVR